MPRYTGLRRSSSTSARMIGNASPNALRWQSAWTRRNLPAESSSSTGSEFGRGVTRLIGRLGVVTRGALLFEIGPDTGRCCSSGGSITRPGGALGVSGRIGVRRTPNEPGGVTERVGGRAEGATAALGEGVLWTCAGDALAADGGAVIERS